MRVVDIEQYRIDIEDQCQCHDCGSAPGEYRQPRRGVVLCRECWIDDTEENYEDGQIGND